MSTVRKLFSVNGIILLTLAISFFGNLAIMAFFGLDRAVDSYFAALMLPSMFMYLVMDYLGKNFLPVYAQRFEQSREGASQLTSTLITVVFLISLVAAAVLYIAAEGLFTLVLPGFSPSEIELVASMFQIMSPTIVLMSLDRIHDYVWQHDERYVRVMVARLYVPVALLVFVLGGRASLGIYALPVGFLVGHIIASLSLIINVPYRYRPRLELSDDGARTILRNSALLMGSGVIARSRELIMQFFASTLGEGAISALAMAGKLCRPISKSVMVGVHMVMFTQSAKDVARRRHSRLGQLYTFSVAAILLGLVPIAVWFAMDADLIVRVIFMRGEFTEAMAGLVATALLGMSASLPFLGINQMLSNGFYALGKIKVPLILMPLGTLGYFGLAWWLSDAHGLLGLAIAKSVWAAGMGVALSVLLGMELRTYSQRTIRNAFVRYVICGFAAVFAAQGLTTAFSLESWAALVTTTLTVAAIYLPLVWVSGDSTIRDLLKHIRKEFVRTEATT